MTTFVNNLKCSFSTCECPKRQCKITKASQNGKNYKVWQDFLVKYDPSLGEHMKEIRLCDPHFPLRDYSVPIVCDKDYLNLLKLFQDQKRQYQQKLDMHTRVLKRNMNLNDDQIRSMIDDVQWVKWSEKTVIESIGSLTKCGETAYEHFREKGYPQPSSRTLRRRLSHLKI